MSRRRKTPNTPAPSTSNPDTSKLHWFKADMHLHTPASHDYEEPKVTYLEWLRKANEKELDIIAITDHNTVAGVAAVRKEIEWLARLEDQNRLNDEEKSRLDEWRTLANKILVLPGFEFTATFGFHILGIFPPETPVSYLEHLLLTLNVPLDKLREGSSTVGATTDVLTAYRVINQAGGIVIAAHVNSGNGVFMRGLDFGGQTRIAYTQDVNLHALEVTDLDKRGRYNTRRFFDGSKPEYPRPMRCIQGSDAHRLMQDPDNPKSLGIGERITEMFMDEVSFDGLAKVLKGNDFSLSRQYRGRSGAIDFVQVAREEGESIVQAFHNSMAQRGGFLDSILRDVCAMANTNGGTVYIGVSANPKEEPAGVRDASKAIELLTNHISNRFSPEPVTTIDSLPSQGKPIVRITIETGRDIPYAIDHNKFYVRDEDETSLAVRDEIVRLTARGLGVERPFVETEKVVPREPVSPPTPASAPPPAAKKPSIESPRTGVEVVDTQKRDGVVYHTVRDLRNGNLIKNVTRSSARKLWHYAITQAEAGKPKPSEIKWRNNIAVLSQRQKGDSTWYDLALRDGSEIHIYYGVTDSGLNDAWLALIENK